MRSLEDIGRTHVLHLVAIFLEAYLSEISQRSEYGRHACKNAVLFTVKPASSITVRCAGWCRLRGRRSLEVAIGGGIRSVAATLGVYWRSRLPYLRSLDLCKCARGRGFFDRELQNAESCCPDFVRFVTRSLSSTSQNTPPHRLPLFMVETWFDEEDDGSALNIVWPQSISLLAKMLSASYDG